VRTRASNSSAVPATPDAQRQRLMDPVDNPDPKIKDWTYVSRRAGVIQTGSL
jgi:hypothetical protein